MIIEKTKRVDTYSIQFSIKEEERIVGWAFLVVIQNNRHTEPYGLLENVYVEKAYRGKGFGTALVNIAIEHAKEIGCYKIIAQSRHGKEGVHKMYKSFDFTDHGKNFRIDFFNSTIQQED